jgi:hypothetical protein
MLRAKRSHRWLWHTAVALQQVIEVGYREYEGVRFRQAATEASVRLMSKRRKRLLELVGAQVFL